MISALLHHPWIKVRLISGVFPNPARGKRVKGWFWNGVALVESPLFPLRILRVVKFLERKLGRWGDKKERPADFDLLLWFFRGRLKTFSHPHLTIPHPRMKRRSFVTVPLALLRRDLPAGYDPELHRLRPRCRYGLRG
jgi:2-amino-4-hydroxy-6-hydroxymethyldihydropteridine diphosphokinase